MAHLFAYSSIPSFQQHEELSLVHYLRTDKNQIALAYEGHTDYIDEKLNTNRSIDDIFRNAQRAFNEWSNWDVEERTTDNLLRTAYLRVENRSTVAANNELDAKLLNEPKKLE